MLSTQRGQVVRVVHSTGGEWCYVEDRHANKGYVPISYLKAYQQPKQTTATNAENNTITTTAQLEKVNMEEPVYQIEHIVLKPYVSKEHRIFFKMNLQMALFGQDSFFIS